MSSLFRAFPVLLAVLALASSAAAQSITVTSKFPDRVVKLRPDAESPYTISYADCLANDTFTFESLAVSYSGYNLEVWAGTSVDCTAYESRYGSAPTCWQVYSQAAQYDKPTITLRVQDIIAQNKTTDATNGPGSGTATDCDTSGASATQTATLYFMLVDGSGNTVGTGSTYEAKYDLLGPSPPTGLSAGIGENRLIVGWSTIPTASDLLGYKIYCDPAPGTTSPANTPMAADGGADASVDGGGGAAGFP